MWPPHLTPGAGGHTCGGGCCSAPGPALRCGCQPREPQLPQHAPLPRRRPARSGRRQVGQLGGGPARAAAAAHAQLNWGLCWGCCSNSLCSICHQFSCQPVLDLAAISWPLAAPRSGQAALPGSMVELHQWSTLPPTRIILQLFKWGSYVWGIARSGNRARLPAHSSRSSLAALRLQVPLACLPPQRAALVRSLAGTPTNGSFSQLS